MFCLNLYIIFPSMIILNIVNLYLELGKNSTEISIFKRPKNNHFFLLWYVFLLFYFVFYLFLYNLLLYIKILLSVYPSYYCYQQFPMPRNFTKIRFLHSIKICYKDGHNSLNCFLAWTGQLVRVFYCCDNRTFLADPSTSFSSLIELL